MKIHQLWIQAAQLYIKHKLWKYSLGALIVTSALLIALIYTGSKLLWNLSELLVLWLHKSFSEYEWILTLVEILLKFLSVIIVLALISPAGRIIVMIVLPLWMEKMVEALSGKKHPGGFSALWRSIQVGLWQLFVETFFIILYLLVNILIPLLTPVWLVLLWMVQAYLWGVALTDYYFSIENEPITIRKLFWTKHKKELVMLGLLPLASMYLPVIGWFITLPIGVISAYLYMEDTRRQNSLKSP